MITKVGKTEGNWFTDDKELLNFDCDELRAIDGLWVKYSNGRFGFSVQKNIYLSKEIGGRADGQYHEKAWTKFCHAVGWQFVELDITAPRGHFPVLQSYPAPRYIGDALLAPAPYSLLSHPDL